MERERITISVKKDVLSAIDETIDGTKVRNRSHAIETLVLKSIGETDSKNALILLGGDSAQKSIPAAEDFLFKLKSLSFDTVKIAVGFLADKIKNKLGDGTDLSMNLDYTDKGEGTGGALLAHKKYFKSTFVVLNSANILDIDLKFLFDYHKKHHGVATIATDNLGTMKGIYIAEPEIFDYIPSGFSMLEERCFPKMIKEGKAVIYPLA